MAIVYENSPFGTGLALRMMWFCRENDIDVRRIIPYHRERLQPEYYHRILAPLKMKGEPPDVIYMVSYLNDALAVVKEIRELKLKSLLCGGAGGFTHPNFIKIAGDDANYVLTATLWYQEMQYPGTKEFYEQYVKRYEQRPDYHVAEAYSALMVAADALRRAESLSPESIRAALNDTNMATPFGPVKFSSYENFERQNRLPTQVLQVIAGKFKAVWPRDLATAKFVPPPDWRVSENK
jgi:branched-chain amino acid transport system substrate-binding protein